MDVSRDVKAGDEIAQLLSTKHLVKHTRITCPTTPQLVSRQNKGEIPRK